MVHASGCNSGLCKNDPRRFTETIAVMIEPKTIANMPRGKLSSMKSEILGKMTSAVRGTLPAYEAVANDTNPTRSGTTLQNATLSTCAKPTQ